MELLTDDDRRRLPALYATFFVADPVAHVMFFTPWSVWTWFAIEFDGKDTFFGLIRDEDGEELGCFSLLSLYHGRRVVGLEVVRHPHFKPTPLSKLRRSAA